MDSIETECLEGLSIFTKRYHTVLLGVTLLIECLDGLYKFTGGYHPVCQWLDGTKHIDGFLNFPGR